MAGQLYKGAIESSDDLNSYCNSDGIYLTRSAANQPSNFSAWTGFLRVIMLSNSTNKVCIQIWTTNVEVNRGVYVRLGKQDEWSDWKLLF